MRLPRLEIRSQIGTIDVRTRAARLEGTPPYLTADTKGNAGAKIQMETAHPRVEIDSTASRESMGIYKTFKHIEKFAAESNQRGINQIGRIAREGLQIMKIERDGGGGWDACRRIAKSKGMKGPARVTIRAVAPPKITAYPGTVRVRDVSEKVQTSVREGADTTKYTPASLSVSWRTEPQINITFIPGQHAGQNVDQVI